MPSGFSFPPPPPPPPKASSTTDSAHGPSQQHSLRRGHGRDQRSGNPRGGGRGGRGAYSHSDRGGTHDWNEINAANVPGGLPPGAFVNPAFANEPAAPYPHARVHGFEGATGHKRPHSDEQHGSWERQTRHAPRPMRSTTTVPKVPAAPAVPSFGSALPLPPKPLLHAVPSKGPLSTNKLGLNPSLGPVVAPSDDSDVDEEEDVDEEAAFTTMSTGPLLIEHEGGIIKLQSGADIKDWIQQRQNMFPSQSRIQAKAIEVRLRMEERRRIELEAEQLTRAGYRDAAAQNNFSDPSTSAVKDTTVSASNRKTDASRTQSDDQVKSGDRELSPGSDSAPEQTSSKSTGAADQYAATLAKKTSTPRICNTYQATGQCIYGHRCRYQHPPGIVPRQKLGGGRMSLYQRLVEQEKNKENQLALQAIKFLGDSGFFRRQGPT